MKASSEQLIKGHPCFTETERAAVISRVQARVAPKLSELNSAIQSQNSSIQVIQMAFVTEAQKAREVVDRIIHADKAYRDKFINLPKAIVRLAVDICISSEVIAVAEATMEIISNSYDTLDEAISTSVTNMQKLLTSSHQAILQDVEAQLTGAANIGNLNMAWELFRDKLQKVGNAKFKELFDKYINSPDFIALLVDEHMMTHPQDDLFAIEVAVGKRACELTDEIIAPLKEKIDDIETIAQGAAQEQGSIAIRHYFQKLYLANELLSHKDSGRRITKFMGHQAAKHFPSIIAQKKYIPFSLFGDSMKYKGRQVTREEYKEDLRDCPVTLGMFWGSQSRRDKMFFELTQQLDTIQEELTHDIRAIASDEAICLDDLTGDMVPKTPTTRRGSFYLRRDFSTSSSIFAPPSIDSERKLSRRRSVVLLSHRPLHEESSSSDALVDLAASEPAAMAIKTLSAARAN